jgi:hypothetical protein
MLEDTGTAKQNIAIPTIEGGFYAWASVRPPVQNELWIV